MPFLTKNSGDEFYTTRKDVRNILEQYVPILRGRRILCPCDTSESEFVKYFLDNDLDVTWDDRLDWSLFDFSEYDFVVTNPPFSRVGEFLGLIDEADVGGIVIIPTVGVTDKATMSLFERGWRASDTLSEKFMTPEGELVHQAVMFLYSSEFPKDKNQAKKRRERPRDDVRPSISDEGFIVYDRSSSVPSSWEGEIAVPVHWAAIGFDPNRHQIVRTVAPKINGRRKFRRLIVRERKQS